MNYNVVFFIEIYSLNRNKCAYLSKSMALPFPPFIGLELDYHDVRGHSPVKRVRWITEKETFHCEMEQQRINCKNGTSLAPECLIDELKENGWEGDSTMYELE